MKLTKIKQVYRVFFPVKYTKKQVIDGLFKNIASLQYHKVNEFYEIKLNSGIVLRLRDGDSSDISVFNQIFNRKEYKPIIDLLKLNKKTRKENIIIDAGANIGLTSIFLLQNLPNSRIYAIEPGLENVDMYRFNTSKYSNLIILFNNALCDRENQRFSVVRNFRDGKDWSLFTEKDKKGEILGITLEQIIYQNKLKYISLLKIDVEGAERYIFGEHSDLSFLEITEILAIEIHDEFNVREDICNILRSKKFILLETGELTIAINRRLF